MAGKSGRTISNVPESPVKRTIMSWEGILVLVLILVNIFCACFSEFYNIGSLLNQMPIYLAEVFLMLPMAFILVLGEIDISVGSITCLCATTACLVCNTGAPFPVVILASLGVGAVCGMVNGFILTRFTELPPMIVTLATQIIYRGIAEIVLGSGGSISANNTDGFKALGKKLVIGGELNERGRLVGGIGIPYILFLVVILAVIFAIVLGKSTFGRRVYAIGTNRTCALYSGIHVQKIRFIIYTVMGLMAGLCSLFLVSSSYGANTTTGTGFEMEFVILCLRVGLGQRNVHAQVILLILGALLIAAVALPNIIGQLGRALKKK